MRAPGGPRLGVLTLVLALSVAVALPPLAAQAHEADSYYDLYWFTDPVGLDSPRELPWAFSPTFEDEAKDDAIAATEAWNEHAGRLVFRHVGEVARDPGPDSCPLDPIDDVHVARRGPLDGPSADGGGILAIAALCAVPGTQIAQHFTVTYDRDEPWFFGDGLPARGEFDLQGILAHEFGHATGWGRHFEENTGTECLLAQRHTMCSTVSPGTLDPRSLEPHDIDTFEDAY